MLAQRFRGPGGAHLCGMGYITPIPGLDFGLTGVTIVLFAREGLVMVLSLPNKDRLDACCVAFILSFTTAHFLGCGESHTPSKAVRSQLKQIHLAYQNFLAANNRPPDGKEELYPFFEQGVHFTDSGAYRSDNEAFHRFKEGDLIAVWGLSSAFDPEEDFVVAYEKRTPLTGGFVVMANWKVKWMDAAELNERIRSEAAIEPQANELLSSDISVSKISPEATVTKADSPFVESDASPAASLAPLGEWDRQSTADDVCSAEFPHPPELSELAAAGRVMLRMTLQRANGNGFYALNVMKQHSEDPKVLTLDEQIDTFRDNHLAMSIPDGSKFELLEERPIKCGDIVGREVTFLAGNDKVSLNQLFVFSGSTYRANIVIDKDKRNSSDVRRFFKSIRFSAAN